MQLVVITPFLTYATGDIISDGAAIALVLATYPDNVVKISEPASGPAETLSVVAVTALIGLPCQIQGNVANATLPQGLRWSIDGGATWTQALAFQLLGQSWVCYGPAYLTTGAQAPLLIQDAANPAMIAAAPAFTVNAATGVEAVAGLSGNVTVPALKQALALQAGDIAGLGSAATASFGTVTGSVADGGILAATILQDTATAAQLQDVLAAGQVNSIAGLSGVVAASSLKSALDFGAGDIAGLGNAATANFGTIAGSVADGGALALATQQIAAAAQQVQALEAAGQVSSIAGLSGSITAPALKSALDLGAPDIAGLGNAATANFGTVTGSVADGGALATVSAGLASAIQATPANVGKALAGGGLGAVAWQDVAGSAGIFTHGAVPAPLPARNGIAFADTRKLGPHINFGELWDTEANYDAWPKLQSFLLYCQSMALAMKNTAFDSNCFRMHVTAYLPRGFYLVSQPLVVPEYVNLHTDGIIVRAPFTGDQSNNGTTSVPGAFYAAAAGAQGQFEPTVILAPRAHASKLNVYVGNTNINYRGSGVAIGKTWQAQPGACTIGAAGANYAAGDIIVLAQPSASTYWPCVVQVTAVNASGGVTAATLYQTAQGNYETGAYGLPPNLQAQQWTAANGFAVFDPANPGCFLQTKAFKSDFVTPSAGTGASIAPAWAPDFAGGQYNIGAVIQTDTLVGHLNVTGFVPSLYSQTYGGTWAVLITGLNGIVDEIEVLGGNDGVYFRFANDWRITTMNCVGAGCGLEIYGCGSIECPNVVFDTCGAALLINQSDRIQVRGLAFFEQQNISAAYAFPASLENAASQGFAGYSALQIGQSSTVSNPTAHIDVAMTLVNMGGLPASTIALYPGTSVGGQSPRAMPYAMTLSYTYASRFDLRVTNIGEQGGAATLLPAQGFVCFGQMVDASNEIRGTIDGAAFVTGPAATSTTGHAWPACSIRIWDATVNGWQGAGGVYDLTGSGAPVNGTTGAGKASTGSTYRDIAGPGLYLQSGPISAPVWTKLS